MAWVYLDDQFPDHPKVVAAGEPAAYLFVVGLAYCRRQETEGLIPKAIVPRLVSSGCTALARRLVNVGLWEDLGDHYRVAPGLVNGREVWLGTPVDFITRERNRITPAVRARTLERCGYRCVACGATEALEVDHMHPVSRGGTSDDENLTILCSPCNRAKGTDDWPTFISRLCGVG